jgi:ketosteroid isomerase-like protein
MVGLPPSQIEDSLAVRAIYDERVAGLESGDLDRWLSAHSRTVRFMNPGEEDIVGTDALRAWGQPFFDTYTMKLGEQIEELGVDGRVAFIRVGVAAEFLPKGGGPMLSFHSKMLLLMHREDDGKWRVTHNISCPAPPPKN